MASYRRVLVGTDGSESSFRAVSRAAALAADAGAQLLLLCAYRPLSGRERSRAAAELGEDAYQVMGAHPAEDVLREAARLAKEAGAPEANTLTVEGDPVDALVAAAGEHSVDLIVVGNRGLNSLAGRLLGSVPANVSHRARCDVLIVHTT